MMIFKQPLSPLSGLRKQINDAYLADETTAIDALLPLATISKQADEIVTQQTRQLVEAVRLAGQKQGGIDAFLRQYDLSSEEGVVLMCLAEALLRIPDNETADKLIKDKLNKAQWDQHLGQSPSLFVNASTWGLMLTGHLVQLTPKTMDDTRSFLGRSIARLGESVIRTALKRAMLILAQQFVMGETIEAALEKATIEPYKRYLYSFDMLGETALTMDDSQRYFKAYQEAITALGEHKEGTEYDFATSSVSVKLSALHPRYEYGQRERVLTELFPLVLKLAQSARDIGVGLTLDAEETDRLELMLDLFEQLFTHDTLQDWSGLGLAVQAYQKRAIHVIEWLAELAQVGQRKIPLRLVKGAYWDTEIKRAQERGLTEYPVFTRKGCTDIAYLACAKRILGAPDAFYPQFATHNARTIATLQVMAEGHPGYEFQRLHGMGVNLYQAVMADGASARCRVYAPVGKHEDLLPYLVRRLLENGANTSFVNSIEDEHVPVAALIVDPVRQISSLAYKPHPNIVLPGALYGEARINSQGVNLFDPATLYDLSQALSAEVQVPRIAQPIVSGVVGRSDEQIIYDPACETRQVGTVHYATIEQTQTAMAAAAKVMWDWRTLAVTERVAMINRAAELFETHRIILAAMIMREGGRTLPDAFAEIREAVDFCRYYASRALQDFDAEIILPGPTGERNVLSLHGRGVFVCISPWNFPLAIFVGQVVAALVAGNTVLAKPASQTPFVAMRAVQLLHEAGVPGEVLQFLPCYGSVLAKQILSHEAIAGVAFTGSIDTAQRINLLLAQRQGSILPLIAETGGLNVMVVDSSAHPEQVVMDVVQSAFNSAGQRCSALRVLFIQEDVAEKILTLLKGAMAELSVGDPEYLSTDIGPVINQSACQSLSAHVERMRALGDLIYTTPVSAELPSANYFAPHAFEIDDFSLLQREVFGPVLHVIRYQANHLEQVIETVNRSGYGLTLGIHSRIEASIRYIFTRAQVGNIYVNRNMIGAVVGVQPFGGVGLSGTGPKAGGPYYLHRFATEQTVSDNISAIGGNAQLLAMNEDFF